MNRRPVCSAVVAVGCGFLSLLSNSGSVRADPCGMVPPVYLGNDVPIVRVGVQNTFVFYKDGIETFVIRPGFEGKVDEFGMLIPFPSVPAIRKVSDHIFPHIAAAVDPPEVVIDLRQRFFGALGKGSSFRSSAAPAKSGGLKFNQVLIVKEEAVGMYEVAVLEAGSAQALKRWVDDHGYKYPKGMDAACNDYVKAGWCFVAVKTKVGQKRGVDPKPGMRKVSSKLPAGSTFDGHVQAMGFRFRVDELVVPMRLSTFNEGDLHNIVYVLSDGPRKIRSVPEEYVVRQISGKQLFKNVTDPLPLRIIGGTFKDMQPFHKQNLKQRRDPLPHNGAARDLFASDLLAVREGRLSHPHEETEKMLLRIGERLSLRGPDIDKLNQQSLKKEREQTVKAALADLKTSMTLSVIDGNFPREVLAEQNLTFADYRMSARRNKAQFYDAKLKGPAPKKPGSLTYSTISFVEPIPSRPGQGWRTVSLAVMVSFVFIGLAATRGHKRSRWTFRLFLLTGLAVGIFGLVSQTSAAEKSADGKSKKPSTLEKLTTLELIDQLSDPKKASAAADAIIARGKPAVPDLLGEAFEGNDMVLRGWAIVCLSEIGGDAAKQRLTQLHNDPKQPALVRTWAAAGRAHMAQSTEELLELAKLIPQHPALGRPIGMRLVEKLSEKGQKVSAEDMLNVTIRVRQLQKALAPAILALGADSLVKAMLTAKNQQVRRQAAAYLGTLAVQGEKTVGSAVVAAYKFDPKAKQVSWAGGPLFIPGIKWSKQDARALVGNLVSWHLWCDLHNQKPQQRPIHNNLNSLQLARAAGYQIIRGQNVGTDAWLRVWGQAVGKKELGRLLSEQKVADQPRFKRILAQLD